MRAIDAGILVCDECHQLNRIGEEQVPRCSRCGAKLHPRRPNSIARTWALLISAMILYVPANLLPIMTVNMLGKGSPATIMGGVVTLIQADMFPIALVVFVASIVVPT
ncbi:paraquat-inducible protein A, partial [Pseudomonas aeruginosa]